MTRLLLLPLCISISVFLYAQDEFITKWNIETDGELLTIPIQPGYNYDFIIDWGDGSQAENLTDVPKHTYAQAGVYDVKISGKFPSIYLNNEGDKDKLLEVSQWGTIKWEAMNNAFDGAEKMQITASDVPDLSIVTSLSGTFKGCSTMNADLSGWDIGNVQSLSFTFLDAEKFNGNISNWNTSNVQSLSSTFDGATEFNQDISSWDVSQVGNMGGTFKDATSFNQSLNDWDVSGVTNFIATFENATSFNQPLDEWNTESAVFMISMFEGAASFNQYLGPWDVRSVTLMSDMFRNASSFNRPLHDWEIEQVTSLSNFLTGSNYGVTNYEKTLIFWSVNITQSNVTFGAGDLTCCNCIGRELLISEKDWLIIDGGKLCNRPFIFTYRTYQNNEEVAFRFPTGIGTFDIDWENDGIIDDTNYCTILENDPPCRTSASHIYPNAGDHQIAIHGSINEFPNGIYTDSIFRNRVFAINQWGDMVWRYMSSFSGVGSFSNMPNLVCMANDHPNLENVDSFEGTFESCSNFNGHIGDWDVSNINNMSRMFKGTSTFNEDLSRWDVSTVEDMSSMFSEASSFNTSINNWDVRGVSNFHNMFSSASDFNQPLFAWNIRTFGPIDMSGMFKGAISFNQPLSTWNTEGVTTMSQMFLNAVTFNQNINNWDVSEVTDFSYMFWNANAYNQPLNNWTLNITDPVNMREMFLSCENFNQDLDEWDVSQVVDMSSMFEACTSFNGSLDGWNTSNVTNMSKMFRDATMFNQSINHFDPIRSNSLKEMFFRASSYNQPMNFFNTTGIIDFDGMFGGASSFNQDLSFWNVRAAQTMSKMFHDAAAFDQSLADWDPINTTNMTDMLSGSALSRENYDATLESWGNRDPNGTEHLQDNVNLGAEGLIYCNAELFRAALEFDGWSITGDTKECTQINCGDYNNYDGPDGGDWNDPANWARGTVPDECDHVLIGLDKSVNLSANAECFLIDVFEGASLNTHSFQLHVSGTLHQN